MSAAENILASRARVVRESHTLASESFSIRLRRMSRERDSRANFHLAVGPPLPLVLVENLAHLLVRELANSQTRARERINAPPARLELLTAEPLGG